ncbi:MAG TPA: crotonase/enoyl-CoA hydratase family protein [Phenylobacterium sp.]|uniref:crotonase/enoyl-CoA hydratase family protein n=1 Tax=Phenylobacterium sp. TaxID=1871053 RepID=UPI002B464629|nr:crotonase/enoyl-CoA hydratase family protein [Phenylobacterium sp.]HKR89635.1 crotonase/enoyl-CoA hydratase family protein [Phenylobacterium sp.]
MTYETIKYAVEDGIATVTLDRPGKLNAFTAQMMREMIDAFDEVDRDDNVRAVIVTGAGRAFCAGSDLSAGAGTFDATSVPDAPFDAQGKPLYSRPSARDGGGLLTLRIFQCLKPVIGCINGAAVGIGATLTLAMDVRLASEDARFGFVFARRGIVPEAASSWFLPRLVGISRALEWCFSGRLFPAEEAREAGLVRQVLAPDQLLPAAVALAREIADNTAPVSVALTRQMMWRGLGMAHPMEAHRVDSRGILSRGRSPDAAEGVNAFLEKRSPIFPDRVSSDMPDYFPWWEEPAYR